MKFLMCFNSGMNEINARTTTNPDKVASALSSIHIGNCVSVAMKGGSMSKTSATAFINRPLSLLLIPPHHLR